MRKLTVSLIVSTCLMYSNLVFAQGESSLLFLKISPSPILNGMGQVGAALPNTEAYGFYYNPAQLGNSSRTVNVAFQFYPSKTDWLPAFNFSGLTYDNLALNLGYNFKNRFKSIPLSVGLGYMRGIIDYGKRRGRSCLFYPILIFPWDMPKRISATKLFISIRLRQIQSPEPRTWATPSPAGWIFLLRIHSFEYLDSTGLWMPGIFW